MSFSGERTRLACWSWRLAKNSSTKFALARARSHARRVRSPAACSLARFVSIRLRRTKKSLVLSGSGLLCSNPVKRLVSLIILGFLSCSARLDAAERSDADATLRTATSFAIGGVGVAGTMSQRERALREVLKQSDAVARLESMLPQASPAGQLYALLGLRARDRNAYKQALLKYGEGDASVQTMRGCILRKESFAALINQIDHGDYDASLSRDWPKR